MARPPAARPSASTRPPAAVLSSELKGRPSANRASRPRLELLGGPQVEPFAEFQEIGGVLGQTGDARKRMHHHPHALALLPEHQCLRLGLDDGLGSQQVLAQLGHLGAVRTGLPAPAHGAVGERSGDGGAQPWLWPAGRRCAPARKGESAAAIGNGNHQRRHDERRSATRSSATSRRGLLPVLSVLASARHISPSIGPTRNRLTRDQKREREDLSR